jgi:hypothetical protein
MSGAMVTITGTVTGGPAGGKFFGGSVFSSSAIGETLDLVLSSGDTTVSVPSGATGVLITPPATGGSTYKLKGAGGDTGVQLHATNPTLLCLASGQTSIIINSAGACTGAMEFSFF